MEQSFIHERYRLDGDSIIISDSDEDNVVENFTTASLDRHAFVTDKNYDGDSYVLANSTPKKNKSIDDTPVAGLAKCIVQRKIQMMDSDSDRENLADSLISYLPIKNNNKKRKDISHDNSREDIKGLKLDSSNESLEYNNLHKQNDIDHEISNHKISDNKMHEIEIPRDVAVTIELDTDSSSGRNSESEVALSSEKQGIGVGNIDPLVTQKRAIMVRKLEQFKDQLTKTKLLLTEGNIEILPDKGQRVHESIREQETEIEKLTFDLEKTPLVQSLNSQENKISKESMRIENASYLDYSDDLDDSDDSDDSDGSDDSDDSDYSDYSDFDISDIPLNPTTFPELKRLGKKAQATRDRELALTVERLKDLHGSLVARPSEHKKAEDPRGLKVQLMPHQQHALAWLLWREQQRPAGGVLGKYLKQSDYKLIIVSQWTTLLDVIASHLPTIKDATFSKFTGNVAIKDRQNVVDSFNSRNSGPRILLLSLTAGGVGLNLIGGNHLLLFDNHWNPQLETQAQDRIYRFGQIKNVFIYKFICVDTIEERVKALQERKLEIASSVLSGDKNNASMKLTLNDLKSLFGF
ncbi:uncharacterized protein LOC115240701 [Formica exsecta]|uniref:uncharacterized protein LOC115240701 n=1 Tax=Formica exsecta TaxID=72781 RepID=UPI001143B613|nr:uncharacterized protein LOC115240701 [Formica exsecta]